MKSKYSLLKFEQSGSRGHNIFNFANEVGKFKQTCRDLYILISFICGSSSRSLSESGLIGGNFGS